MASVEIREEREISRKIEGGMGRNHRGEKGLCRIRGGMSRDQREERE